MAQEPRKRKRPCTEYPALLRAARTPLAPRWECAVFGCPLPPDPDRRRRWLKLIRREELEGSARLRSALVCDAHFSPGPPDPDPSLLLPAAVPVEYRDADPTLQLKDEIVLKDEPDEEADTLNQIEFEPELPPTYTFHVPTEPPNQPPTIHELISPPEQLRGNAYLANYQEFLNQSTHSPPELTIDAQTEILDIKPESDAKSGPDKSDVKSGPDESDVKTEPYSDYQVHAEVQTDLKEAFYRSATFSAVEQINIPPSAVSRYTDAQNRTVHSQTTPELLEYFTDGFKKTLQEELDEAMKKLKQLENPHMEKTQFLKACDHYLDEKLANFVKSHVYLSNKFVGKKYPQDFKNFALNLYLLNPQSYKFVEHFFDLPSRRTIQRFHVPVRTGINQSLMESLRVKVAQLHVKGKVCAVSFGVMRLRRNLYYDLSNDYLCGMEEIDQVTGSKPAEYAALVMVRGLYARWKQPVSFALLSDKRQHTELKAWLHKTITALFDIGLLVKALVTNFDEEFLDVSAESQPYFEINECKIFLIYDVPYLLKCVRDALLQHNIHFGNSVAKWEHIVSVYDSDKQQEHSLMANITDKHVRPDGTSINDVKLATQVFSNTVAATMNLHVIARFQSKQTKDTVQFIAKISNLLDILYSRTLDNAYRETSAQKRFLNEAIQWLKSLEVQDKYGNVIDSKFADGLIATIRSVMSLKADLKKYNLNYLLTRNLSLDCVRTHFNEVCHSGNCDRPTPIQFTRVFRKLFLVNLLNNTKVGAEEDDLMTTLIKIGEYVKVDLEKKEQVEERKSLAIGVTDYKISWPSIQYIAGYLLWKCLERHACNKLVEKLCDQYKFAKSDANLLIQRFQCYNAANIHKLRLTPPPKELVEFTNHMQNKYNEYYNKTDRQNTNFGWNVYLIMENDSFNMPCPCFPLKYLKILYIRLKIFSSVKKYSRINKNTQHGEAIGAALEI